MRMPWTKGKTEQQITALLDPWTLACAMGAMNGSIYGSVGSRGRMDFGLWLAAVRKSDWERTTGESEARVGDALRRYAYRNKDRHMEQVFEDEKKARGGQ